jgi:hypothetical protein
VNEFDCLSSAFWGFLQILRSRPRFLGTFIQVVIRKSWRAPKSLETRVTPADEARKQTRFFRGEEGGNHNSRFPALPD